MIVIHIAIVILNKKKMSKESSSMLVGDIPTVTNHNLERISATISFNCYAVIFMCVFSSMVMGVTLMLPGAVPVEKQIFVGLACISVLCPIVVLICARRNPSALLMWIWIAATGSGILIGIAVMILAPHVITPIST